MATPSSVRTLLSATDLGVTESLEVTSPRCAVPRAESYSPDYQICIPYKGLFVWHVGRDDVTGDPTRVLFVRGGEGYRMSQPADAGYAELIVTLPPEVLADHLGIRPRDLSRHPAFRERSRPADWALQRLALRRLHAAAGDWDGLACDEWLLAIMQAGLGLPPPPRRGPSATRVLLRAKTLLADRFRDRVRLSEVAGVVGVSPTHLTTVFTQSEGVSLHQYVLRLRIARALVELPHATDLAGLALDLGFAHHSHFTSAFRRAIGCSPSHYRTLSRSGQRLLAEPRGTRMGF